MLESTALLLKTSKPYVGAEKNPSPPTSSAQRFTPTEWARFGGFRYSIRIGRTTAKPKVKLVNYGDLGNRP
jgi:hypothetical protein